MSLYAASSEALWALIRAAGFAPTLRTEVRVVGRQDEPVVRLLDESRGRMVELNQVEAIVARHMDGSRTMAELTELARHYDREVLPEHVERIAVELYAAGLLEEAPSPMRMGVVVPITARRRAEQPPGEEAEPHRPEPAEARQEAQDGAWQAAKQPSWHQRRWVRALAAIAVLTGAAAIIPYPLHVTAECDIVPTTRARVRSELRGVLAEILVGEGEPVKAGQVIARLDARELDTQQRKAAAEVDRVQAELVRLQRGSRVEEIQRQRAVVSGRSNDVAYARREAKRLARMAAQGLGARAEAERASHDLRIKRSARAEARAALLLLRAGARAEEIAAGQAELDRARAELAFAQEQLGRAVLRSPIDGTLITPKFRERLHEQVEAGGLVCEVAATSAMRAEIWVPERDIDAVQLGHPAVVKVESYPDRPFEGKVQFIAPAVAHDEDRSNRVRVVVELDNAEGLLKQNMTGYGEIDGGKRSLLHLATRRLVRWIRVRFLI